MQCVDPPKAGLNVFVSFTVFHGLQIEIHLSAKAGAHTHRHVSDIHERMSTLSKLKLHSQ